MKNYQIINCFVNGAAHVYFARHNRPMLDEDLSMAFDAAHEYARDVPQSSIADAHAHGHAYASK